MAYDDHYYTKLANISRGNIFLKIGARIHFHPETFEIRRFDEDRVQLAPIRKIPEDGKIWDFRKHKGLIWSPDKGMTRYHVIGAGKATVTLSRDDLGPSKEWLAANEEAQKIIEEEGR